MTSLPELGRRVLELETENSQLRNEVVRLRASSTNDADEIAGKTGFTDRLAEKALRESEARYRSIVQDQTEVISRQRSDGACIFANQAFLRFFGKTEETLIGSKWCPVVYPEDSARVTEQLGMLSPENPVVTIENRVYSGDGQIHWMQFSNKGIFDADGQLIEIQSVGRDISDRKSAELAQLEAHQQLEKHVIERTEQLRQLAVHATLAEERERQAIARDLHDDLGQILHVVRIKFDSLVKSLPGVVPPQVAELNQLIFDASRLVRSLTTQLSPPALRELGLSPALRGLSEEIERNYGLAVDVRAENLPFKLSQTESAILFRAVRELLINSAKHADSDMASVELNCLDDCLSLTVEDDGIGIENIQSVFVGKRGFGLSSIRERILFLGGSMELNTKADGGTRAMIKIPFSALSYMGKESIE